MLNDLMPEIRDSINAIYNHYGTDSQTRKLTEECAELITEISKRNPIAMAQEMADVYIVMTGILQNNEELLEIFYHELEFKIKRQLNRISNG